MKKLLLVFVTMVGIVHQDKAMDIKNKDFSQQFFHEFEKEYSTEQQSFDINLYGVIQELQCEYPASRLENPYLKSVKTDSFSVWNANEKENKQYDEALFSLSVTKKVMEYNLSNVSWFQWLWNYRAYENYKKSMQTLDEEIASFKNQDRVVSPRKGVLKSKGFPQMFSKPELTHREVFTRSNMPNSLFNRVKEARE